MRAFIRTFRSVFVNDLMRARVQVIPIVVLMLVTLASMVFGLYMYETQHPVVRIVYVTQDAAQAPTSTDELDVTVASTEPPQSLLVQQRYDAYVTQAADGSLSVDTLKSDGFKSAVIALAADPSLPVDLGQTSSGPGVQILGFMMMFLLMNAFGGLFVFSQDKEEGQLARVTLTPMSFAGYLTAHCAYCLIGVIPEFALLGVFQTMGYDIGITLMDYLGLMLLLSMLGIAAALLLHTLIHKRDNANMLGNATIMLTSLLAGGFSLAVRHAPVADAIRDLLPQKRFMDFAAALENGVPLDQSASLLYVIGFIAVLLIVSCIILRKSYVHKAPVFRRRDLE